MPDSLVSDLLAAIDETERIAQAATDGPWNRCSTKGVFSGVMDRDWIAGCDPSDGDHIARHDPASVLRRCAADREIVERYLATQTALEAAQGTVLAGACKVRLGAYENVLRVLA